MANTTTSNHLTSGSLDKLVERKAVATYNEAGRFKQFALTRGKYTGSNSFSFYKTDAITATVSGTAATEGVTPTPTTFTMTEVNVTLDQKVITTVMSDVLIEDAPVDVVMAAADELGEKMAKVEDQYIQDQIDGGSNVIYAGNATSRTTIDAADNVDGADLAKAFAYLSANSAPTFGGRYIGIFHPLVLHDIKTDTATGGWLDANKYDRPEMIFKGEVGELQGIRVISSAYIAPYVDASDGAGSTGTVDVYPSFVFGKDSYGVVNSADQGIKTYVRMPEASDSDPAAQRGSVSTKLRIGATIIRGEGLYRIEGSASLGTNT